VEGYAIVFNQQSRKLYDKASKKVFTEVIDPRAVTKAFLDDQDVKMLFNHSNDKLLARSTYGFGTLTYEIDEYGVRYRFEMPNTTIGNDVLEMIRRGDVFGCSFAFSYAKDGVRDEKRNGQNYRTVIQMASIDDFSIVVDPAYMGTYVSTREFCAPEDEPKADMAGVMDVELAMLEMELENL
jgi:HK97 family phage prohead protease